MQTHFQNRHQGVDATKHEALWKLTSEEVKALAQIWKNRRKQPKRRGKGKQRVPLKVSEAHSSRRLTRYVLYIFTFNLSVANHITNTSYIVREDEAEGLDEEDEPERDPESESEPEPESKPEPEEEPDDEEDMGDGFTKGGREEITSGGSDDRQSWSNDAVGRPAIGAVNVAPVLEINKCAPEGHGSSKSSLIAWSLAAKHDLSGHRCSHTSAGRRTPHGGTLGGTPQGSWSRWWYPWGCGILVWSETKTP
jgi:hypothetical protein